MFALRGVAISISVFVLVYGALSIVIASSWRIMLPACTRMSGRRSAQVLFLLRLSPVICAWSITAIFAVPSFLLLEPRFVAEPLGGISLMGTLCGSVIVILGCLRAARSMLESSRFIRTWTRGALQIHRRGGLSILKIPAIAPAMTIAGIVRPSILVSDMAISSLTAAEYQVALRHEFAHLRGRDNLKKLLLHLVCFPGMRELERAWMRASEIAADESAVEGAGDALDLASALLKLSRLGCCSAPKLTTALLENPISVVQARVEHLLACDGRPDPLLRKSRWYIFSAALAGSAMLVVTYGRLLVEMHAATEWLMR